MFDKRLMRLLECSSLIAVLSSVYCVQAAGEHNAQNLFKKDNILIANQRFIIIEMIIYQNI